jgi:putative membrane-bound dehydrogenase-like protein
MRRLFVAVLLTLLPALAHAAEPRLLVDQPGFGLELVAKEPDIVTPIGMAFDTKGRLLVIESHTHQRPDDYQGPKGDRIRVLTDTNRDGRLDAWSTFAEGYQQAMNLCVRPDGAVYLVTRRDVRLLEDTDHDGVSDKDTVILHLETTGNYPHNGMSGIAFHPRGTDDKGAGTLVVGVGENSGIPYTVVGSDGVRLEMRDGAGDIYICQADGSGMRRYATGFWNPFALCFVGNTVYAVDNDPDASPPCRLIEVWRSGDYGFRYQYGRAGVHPLLAWNGELPGTLGPVCGTGEAPTAIVFHHDDLWVTSWGDHRVERYAPAQVGTRDRPARSATRQVVVQGDADFRPTGCAVAPDGSIYFADWVDRSYPVHGNGRIWKLTLPMAANDKPTPGPPFISDGGPTALNQAWGRGMPYGKPFQEMAFDRDYAPDDLQWRWARSPLRSIVNLQAIRWHGLPGFERVIHEALQDENADVRLYAVRWIADERLVEFRDDVAKLLGGEIPNERYFLCVLAAIEWLDGDATPRSAGISDGLLRRELANDDRSPQLHALALRLISPDHEWLTVDRLRGYLASESPELRLEAVRTLAMQTRSERLDVLAEVAGDATRDPQLRAEAVAGLAEAAGDREGLLQTLAESDEPTVAREASRVLRLHRKRAAPDDHPPATDLDAWNRLLAEGGDAEAGRRLFFMRPGALCATCHQHSGRGGRVGPDLSRIGEQQSRERIIASILQPSQEIAPHYQAWQLVTVDGLSHEGLRLPEGGDDGTEPYSDAQGRRFELRSEDIELRSPSQASIMPEGLADALTIDDLRDLVAFLSGKD